MVYRYDYCVFPGKDAKTEMTFDTHYKIYRRLFRQAHIRCQKVTHAHRHTAVTRLQQAGASDEDIKALALWVHDDQHNVYQKLIKPDVLVKEAGFKDQRSYYLWRGQLHPEKFAPDMWKAVFPWVEERLEQIKQVCFLVHWLFLII